MTRKCALCKGTNYKNNYSFFSAPKDAEIRKKWQVALAIKNYTVTDDTYVCSKHFHKNDIITHWISGVPPQVVKVKYKKCRLRPGAVPDIDKEKKKKIQISNESSHVRTSSNMECNIQRYTSSENNDRSIEICEYDVSINSYVHEKIINNNLKASNNLCIKNKILTTLNDRLNIQNKSIYDKDSKNDILFEDFLEICTELSIPHGWSCLITSKGHDTTVVYLYMNITKNGLPFVEKQIFIRSDMILHYSVANREIDPFMHNLIKERKYKIKSLLDVEILIAEFDQRAICQGIHDSTEYKDIDKIKIAYKDGIKWRHISCPLIINNNNSKCIKCVTLSRLLLLSKF